MIEKESDNVESKETNISEEENFSEDTSVPFNNSSFTNFDSFSDTCRLLILVYFSCIALKFVPHLYFCLRALLLRRKSISFQSVML